METKEEFDQRLECFDEKLDKTFYDGPTIPDEDPEYVSKLLLRTGEITEDGREIWVLKNPQKYLIRNPSEPLCLCHFCYLMNYE